jgi:Domain of unknown function (DUF1127)
MHGMTRYCALLLEMSDRELADIGISRSDLPRLCADCAFGGYFYDAFLCGSLADDPPRLLQELPTPNNAGWPVRHGLRITLVRTCAALAAVLLTWAIVSGIGSLNANGHGELLSREIGQRHPVESA